MKLQFKPTLSLITIMLLAISFANAQNTTFDDWDADNDGLIERNEFTSVFVDEYFSVWNSDDQQGLIEEGFFKESYAGLDTDNDGFLSDEEWLLGFNYFYDDYILEEEYAFVDVNNDGSISYNEFYDVIYDTEMFTDIDLDADNYITEYELANYVFENWDFNNSGALSKSEYNRFDWYYLDV